jgi:putative endonuclease
MVERGPWNCAWISMFSSTVDLPKQMEMIAVYILTNGDRTVLYVGVTRNLRKRLVAHFEAAEVDKGFSGKYKTHHLVYFERFERLTDAIAREKQLKGWSRTKKEDLIRRQNPQWTFLEYDI